MPAATLDAVAPVGARVRRRPGPGLAVVGGPALVALVLSVAWSWRPSYWLDEGATLSASTRSLPHLAGLLRTTDLVHGAYYVAMHPWVGVSRAEWWVRLPSALSIAAAAALLAVLGWQLAGRRAGAAAGLLFAVIPLSSYFGMEARGYAVSAALLTASTVLLVQASRSRSRWWWVAWAVVSVIAAVVFLFGALLLVGQAVWLVLTCRSRRTAVRFAVSAAVVVVLVSPFAVAAGRQSGQVSWIRRPTLGGSVPLVSTLWFSGSTPLALAVWSLVGVGVVVAVVRRQARAAVLLGLAVGAAGPVLLLAVSQVHPLFAPRYAFAGLVGVALAAGVGASRLPTRAGWWVAVVVVAALGAGAQVHQRAVDGKGDDMREVAGEVASQWRPGDVVLYEPGQWRSIDEAYPEQMAGRADLTEAVGPVGSDSLTGVDVPTAAIRTRLVGVQRVWWVHRDAVADSSYDLAVRQELVAAGFPISTVRVGGSNRTDVELVPRVGP